MKHFFPVIHCQSLNQTLEDFNLAFTSHANGVMLINMGDISDLTFLKIAEFVSQSVKQNSWFDFRIGINFLTRPNLDAFKLALKLKFDYLWVDNAGTDYQSLEEINSIRRLQLETPGSPRIFGGIHFKYQPQSKFSIEESLQRAHGLIDIPTLSGRKTGSAADLEFIQRAKNAAKDKSLAIASGISEDNVEQYLPYIDYFLVASSLIDKNSGKFISKKVKSLEKLIHNYGPLES